jgi:hypothetical protein
MESTCGVQGGSCIMEGYHMEDVQESNIIGGLSIRV